MNFKEKRGRWIHTALFAAAAIFSAGFCMEARAASVPEGFTVQSVIEAGIEDKNFASAVYESIAGMIREDKYPIDPAWDTRQILENFSNENLKDNIIATIYASDKNIKSIVGITLLKNCNEIRLESNDIHDLSPLKLNTGSNKLFFNGANILIDGDNYQNIIPAELVGTDQGNITVDNSMIFDPASLAYVFSDTQKTVDLDFDIEYHGDKGGIFNQGNSERESINEANAVYSPYADYRTRYTGTTITFPGRDGNLTIAANADVSAENNYPAAIHYWSAENLQRTLNLEWLYPFHVTFYRTVKERYSSEIFGGIHLIKKGPDGERLSGAVYELYRVHEDGSRTRYPDDSATFRTGSNGELTVSHLPAGTYEFREISAPKGYVLNSDPVRAIVSERTDLIQSALQGGETEAEVNSDVTAFKPVWDRVSVTGANGRSSWHHVMEMTRGTRSTVQASDYDADCFIKNGGSPVTALRGESISGSGMYTAEGTKICLYAADPKTGSRREVGTFDSAEAARSALNQMISDRSFTEDTGNIEIEAHFVYQCGEELYAEVSQTDPKESPEQPKTQEPETVPAELVKKIRVQKTWDGENHPLHAFFRLILKLHDGTERAIGKIKEVSEQNGWMAVWSFQEIRGAAADAESSPGDASEGSASDAREKDADGEKASGSNAAAEKPASGSGADAGNLASGSDADPTGSNSEYSAAKLYDEDGELLDGMVMDDLAEGIAIEEVQIPDGWVPDYDSPDMEAEGDVTYLVTNRWVPEREQPKNPDSPEGPENPVPESPKPEKPENEEPHETSEEHENPGHSGGSSSGTPKKSKPGAELPAEEIPQEEQVLGYEKIHKKVGLPWGSVAGKRAGVPKTGEKSGVAGLLISASVLWSLAILFYLVTAHLRKKLRSGKED